MAYPACCRCNKTIHYGFGTFLHYADAQHACTASALEKALSSSTKRVIRQIGEEPQPAPPVELVSPLEGTLPSIQLQHREQFWQFVLHEAEPQHRERLTRLLDVWEEANRTYYAGALVRPIILLAEPSNPRRLGDCGPVSGWGAAFQIRIRPSLLEGTHPTPMGYSMCLKHPLPCHTVAAHQYFQPIMVSRLGEGVRKLIKTYQGRRVILATTY